MFTIKSDIDTNHEVLSQIEQANFQSEDFFVLVCSI